VFEHPEGDMDKLAHNGADDTHFGFASGTKSGSKVTQRCIVFDGDKSRHVESFSEVSIALFA
jgi:hypothetical protein